MNQNKPGGLVRKAEEEEEPDGRVGSFSKQPSRPTGRLPKGRFLQVK
jgi:hypothetical protein